MTSTPSLHAMIMAGGSGTRFWPLSSIKRPKQLLKLTGKRSQIQLTSERLDGLVKKSNRFVVCTEALEKATKAHLPGIKILGEPMGRNTMAAACWGAWSVAEKDPDATLIVLPADAHIGDVKSFNDALSEAVALAQKHYIVCLGIKPTFAATGYGYIQNGESLGAGFKISRFVEKPNETKAQEFLSSGGYAWNAGIFVFKVSDFLSDVREHAPDFAKYFDENIKTPKKLKAKYKNLPKISIDVALMEKSRRGAVIHGEFGWNDIGSWRALEDVIKANSAAGVIQAPAGFLSIESQGVVVNVTDKKFVGLVGVSDLIVVETKDALLICRKDKAEQVKELVGMIEKNKKLKKLL